MENSFIPPEYASQLEAAERKKRMAQMLMQRSMSFQGAQSQGRIASKTPALAWLANLGTMGLAGYNENQASKAAGEVRTKAAGAERAELERLQNLPMPEAIKAAAASQFPTARKWGETAQAQRQKMLEGGLKVLGDSGDYNSAFQGYQSGQLPQGWQDKGLPAPKFGADPNGNPYALTQNRKGEPKLDYAPKASTTTINNNIPGDERKFALGQIEGDLKGWKESAAAAKTIYATTTQAVDALESGAKAGGLEGVKQTLRKTLQGFGIETPETASTEQLGMALGNTILSEAAKIKPISNTDITTLKEIVGSISTDPKALTKALAFSQGLAIQTLSDFQKYGSAKEEALTDPLAKQYFAGWNTGYETPGQLSGPLPFQMEVVRSLQKRGYDISQFKDPTGQPFARDSKFEIDPTGGFPGVAGKPASAKPQVPLTIDQLTPAQKQQLLQLLQSQGN